MHKYENRIKKLAVKTHGYILPSDFILVRDYFKACFEEAEKPEDFDELVNEVLQLEKKYEPSKDQTIKERIEEIKKVCPAVFYKISYEDLIQLSENLPYGDLVPKNISNQYKKIVEEAKWYFKNKKT